MFKTIICMDCGHIHDSTSELLQYVVTINNNNSSNRNPNSPNTNSRSSSSSSIGGYMVLCCSKCGSSNIKGLMYGIERDSI